MCYREKIPVRYTLLEKVINVVLYGAILSFLFICILNCQSKLPRRAITFCVPPASPSNGQVSIGSVVTRFSCNPGHKLDGSPVAVCVGGRWSAPVPRCVAAGGKSKKNEIKGFMDVELKDQQIVTAYTHFPKPSRTNQSKSDKRKLQWKKRRRKGRRKKSKGNSNQISKSKKVSSNNVINGHKEPKSDLKKTGEKRKNKLSKRERRMKRRRERKKNKGRRKDRDRRKGKRKNKKRRRKLKDKKKNEIKYDKNQKNKDLKQNLETNSIYLDTLIDPNKLDKGKKSNADNSKSSNIPTGSKSHHTKSSPKVEQEEIDRNKHSDTPAESTKPMKSNNVQIDYNNAAYSVDQSTKSTKVDIVPTQTPKTDLQQIIDRMMTRNGKDAGLLDDFLTLKVEADMKKVRPKIKARNEVRSGIPESSKKLKNKSGKYNTDYEEYYDLDYTDYSDVISGKINSSTIEAAPEQELPAGYPSLSDRLFGRNDANLARERFVEEEDIRFAELDTSCTLSETDSLYLQPIRVSNGHITAYITVTNPAPPNNVYVEANYDCNFGYQLSEPTNSRLFCRKNSWIGLLPKCVPYITGGEICGVGNGGCQHICDRAENSTFICSCYRGFTLHEDEMTCKDVDECAANNGGCEGACFNKLGSYQCYCPKGYRVATNGKSCVDKNECILRNGHGPCQDTCFNTKGSYYCTCDGRSGTTLSADKHTCEDLNECNVDNGGCSHICLNTFGQTFCGCPDGFSLTMDWKTCQDINECDYADVAKQCDLGCINTVGSYRCAVAEDLVLEIECSDGQQLSLDGKECEDIDECSENNFGCSHACVNTMGGAYCDCPSGYDLKDDKECVDIDECNGNHGCSHDCVNIEGSFKCLCPTGTLLAPDNTTCVDLDECIVDRHDCSHQCVNTEGSFKCSCPFGMLLSPDDKTCIDDNECVKGNGGCGQICINLEGSHRCDCQSGYVLIGDHTCEDVDECQQNNAGCQQICTNEPGTFSCSCSEGYDSQGSMCIDIDECELKIAECEQSCENSNGSYECYCYHGYELNQDGVSCRDVDECSDENPCSHFCSNEDGSFVCSCPVGWIVSSDERTCVDVDECEKSKCSHDCENTEGGYKCKCPKGLRLIEEGTSIEKSHLCVDIDECSLNNGDCTHICNNLEGSFECSCPVGFDNILHLNVSNCIDINECMEENGVCSHECINENGSYKCYCPNGLKLNEDGLSCDDVDECSNENGGCSHSCVNLQGTYECTCPTGWEMNVDYYNEYDSNEVYFEGIEPPWKSCMDIDECLLNNGGCSHECINGNGSFYCSCPNGYNLINDYSCEDINECMVDTGPCLHRCINVAGSFKCECPNGFQLVDGLKCRDVNECLDDVCSHYCVNELGTYKCVCPVGFVMEDDNRTCTDFNECGASNGGCSHQCRNTDGFYTCSCPLGTILNNDLHSCEDVNECQEQNGGCSHTCINTIGSHSCTCPVGLMLAVDSKTCLDIDECGNENGGCSHQCSNHKGHYKCVCPSGSQLQSDGHTCEDINECATDNSGCSHKCYNLYGTYECLCPEGYYLQEDNHTCHDVNECEESNGGCEEFCHNTRGSFRCDCERGYQLGSDLLSCKDIDECTLVNGGCSHFCENMPGSFFCSCPVGYEIDADGFQCGDINECHQHPCEHDCINTAGSFYCGCTEGYSSRPDSADLCHDVNECELNNGGCSHDCFNTIGSYYCECPSRFQLAVNDHSCEEKKIFCPLINAPMDSSMRCSSDVMSTAYKAGTTCSFSCRKGTLRGKSSTTCEWNGSWSNILPTCKEIHCPGVPNIEFGVITPYRCIQGTSKVDQHCYLTCNPGYRIIGNPVRTCKQTGTWSPTMSPHCEKDSLKPFIQCPKDMTVDLSPHQSFAYVRLPRPKSNVDWYRFIDSSHDWAKEQEADIPAGVTVITFTAHSPQSEEKASCTFEVFVKDTEIPQVYGCPKSFKMYLNKDEDATEVTFKEPVFKDNVDIVHVYKSLEPGAQLGIGTHPVHYIAVDPQGNRAKCSFVITVEVAQLVPKVYQSNEVWIVCLDTKERKLTRVPAWHVPQGCTVVNPSTGVSHAKWDIIPTLSEVPIVNDVRGGEQQQTSVPTHGVSVFDAMAIANGRRYHGHMLQGNRGQSRTSSTALSAIGNHQQASGIQSFYHDSNPFSHLLKNAHSFAISHARAGSSGSSAFAHSKAGDNTRALAHARARSYNYE